MTTKRRIVKEGISVQTLMMEREDDSLFPFGRCREEAKTRQVGSPTKKLTLRMPKMNQRCQHDENHLKKRND